MIMTYQHRCERVDPFVKGGVILGHVVSMVSINVRRTSRDGFRSRRIDP